MTTPSKSPKVTPSKSPSIDTLVQDVYTLLESGGGGIASASDFGDRLATLIKNKINDNQGGRLRPSNLGERCIRKLWYEINTPEAVVPFDGVTLMKFMIGNTWEEVLLFLAKEAGHSVSHEQHTVELYGVKGSIDCVIDGCLVDVKSASPFAFDKYVSGLSLNDDPFGYIYQANFYLTAMRGSPAVTNKDNAFLFVGDKEKGRLALVKVPRINPDWEKVINDKAETLRRPTVPERAYEEVPFGKSGNMAVPNVCNNWCRSVDTCWPNARKFAYSSGIQRLTKVVRTPDVTEINA